MGKQDEILETIQENPGIHVRGIIKKTGYENGVVLYHLRQLEMQGKARSQRRPKYRRYYPVDVAEEEFPIIRNMRKPTKKDVLLKILIEGTPSFQELTLKIGKSPSTLSWNLSGLVDEGVVEKCKKNGRQCYKVKDKELFRKTFQKEFSKLFTRTGHDEDIFLTL